MHETPNSSQRRHPTTERQYSARHRL